MRSIINRRSIQIDIGVKGSEMKKLEYKLLPCIFCTIGLNSYVAGNNLLHATVQKFTHNDDSHTKNELTNTTIIDNAPIIQNTNAE